jgi:hypothetical protein
MRARKIVIILAVPAILAVIGGQPLPAAELECGSNPMSFFAPPPSFLLCLAGPVASPEAAGPSPSTAASPAPAAPPLNAAPYLQDIFAEERFERSMFTASLWTQVGLNAADYFTTVKALKIPGLAEGNPIMKPFVKNPYVFAAVKTGLTALTHYSLKGLYKRNKTAAWIVSLASNLALSYVVANNMRMIDRARAKKIN